MVRYLNVVIQRVHMRMLKSLSVDEILLPRDTYYSTELRGFPFNGIHVDRISNRSREISFASCFFCVIIRSIGDPNDVIL